MTEYSRDGLFGDFSYGGPGVSKGFLNALMLTQGALSKKKCSILVVGSGNGYELVLFGKKGHDVIGLDIYVPEVGYVKDRSVIGSACNIPFADKQFELVYCTEMLEHVNPKDTGSILAEFKRVASEFYITIATRGDYPFNSHINIHSPRWWHREFVKHGFTISHITDRPSVVCDFGGTYYSIDYPDGVTIYGKC